MLPPSPPLDPSGDEGRRLLRRELLHPEYQQNPFQRLLGWLWRHLESGIGAASGSSWLITLVTMLVAAALVLALVWLVSRVRRDRHERAETAVILEHGVPAAELRRRAERALAEGRHADAVVEGFRAVTARQVERGRLDDQPGATAHEVAARLATAYPDQGGPVGRTADLFDATLYGRHPVTPEDAAGVLALDDTLAGAR
jgi:hypothetical protein